MSKVHFYIILIVSMLVISCGDTPEERLQSLEHEASVQFGLQNYMNAIALWNEALEIAPKRKNLHYNIGKSYSLLGNYSKAIEVYKDALKIYPNDYDLLLKIGKIHLLRFDLPSAEEIIEKIDNSLNRTASHFIFRGDLSLLKNELYEAELDYRQALKMDPENISAVIKLAASLLIQDKKKQSEEVLGSINDAEIKEPFVLEQMGNYWKLAHDHSKAEAMYLKAIDLSPKNLHLKLVLAEYYFEINKYSQAINIIKPLITEGSATIAGKLLMVESLTHMGELSEANLYLSELLKEKPNDIEVQLLGGKYNLLAGNCISAVSNFKFAVDKEPTLAVAHYLLGLSYLAAGHNKLGHQRLINALSLNNKYTDAELALASYYYKQREYDLGLEHVRRIAIKDPENFRAQLIMGNLYLAQKKYNESLICFQKARMIRPNTIEPLYFAAVATEEVGEVEKSAELYRIILEKRPELIDVTIRYMELLLRNGDVDRAREYFLKKLEQNPDLADVTNYVLGKICIHLDDYQSAKLYLKASIENNPGNSAAYMELAKIYHAEGETNEEISALNSAIRHNHQIPAAYIELAAAHKACGSLDKAIQTISKGLMVNSDDPILQNNLATLYMEKNEEVNKAFDLAQRAFEKMNQEPSTNDTLGWAYYKKGHLKQAEWYIREALRLGELKNAGEDSEYEIDKDKVSKKNMVIVHYHLGVVLCAKGDVKGAKDCFKKALSVEVDEKLRKQIEKELKDCSVTEAKIQKTI